MIFTTARVGYINPQWDADEFKVLNYKLDHHKDANLIEQYEDCGHNRASMMLYNYFEPNPLPESILYIKAKFSFLKNISTAVNLFKPGQYLPYHRDLYGHYKRINNLKKTDSVIRCMVMLEDSAPGQIMEIENLAFNTWTAGTVFKWADDDGHSFYNLSLKDRYAIQLTGIC